MFTLPYLQRLIGNYRNATSASGVVKPMAPSMVLGSRKGRGADSAYKTLERSLKGSSDELEAASSFWNKLSHDYGARTVLTFINDKRDSPYLKVSEVIESVASLGSEEGYFWRVRGDQIEDLCRWRGISAYFRGFILYCEARHSAEVNWKRGRKRMDLALAEIERLEFLSAELSSDDSSKGPASRVRFLEQHPLGMTSAGQELLDLVSLPESEQSRGKADRMGKAGLKMALTGVLWQFALVEAFLCPECRKDWPLLLPKMIDGTRWTASRQWVARLKTFVEEGPLTTRHEWPKPSGPGKPSKTRHIAEFLYSHHSDGRKPDKLAEKLGRILNGREQLTFKFVEETRLNLMKAMETNFKSEVVQRFDEQLSTLNLDGQVAGFTDYLERIFDLGDADKEDERSMVEMENIWEAWPTLAKEVIPFIRMQWDEAESRAETQTE